MIDIFNQLIVRILDFTIHKLLSIIIKIIRVINILYKYNFNVIFNSVKLGFLWWVRYKNPIVTIR